MQGAFPPDPPLRTLGFGASCARKVEGLCPWVPSFRFGSMTVRDGNRPSDQRQDACGSGRPRSCGAEGSGRGQPGRKGLGRGAAHALPAASRREPLLPQDQGRRVGAGGRICKDPSQNLVSRSTDFPTLHFWIFPQDCIRSSQRPFFPSSFF